MDICELPWAFENAGSEDIEEENAASEKAESQQD
jgi:hypothetical protein